ncbi:MAG TPA: PspA/IM30 family protein [bacterium]|nr:PspA/IM30 family protein [bacterium]
MSIFQRASDVLRSNINALLSKAEDPEKMLDQMLIDMQEQATKAKSQITKAVADAKRLKKEVDAKQAKAREWGERAKQAVTTGEDDLAKKALTRKNALMEEVTVLKKEWKQQQASVDSLKDQLQQMQRKIDAAKRKKNLLAARAQRAKAQQDIQKSMAGLNDNSAFETFDRMTDKVDQMEAEAEAAEEMADFEKSEDEKLEEEFDKLGQQSNVDDELAELKKQMEKQ